MDSVLNDREPTPIRIKRVFARALRLNLTEAEWNYAGRLEELAGLDSVAVIEFVAALEREFGITIEPDELRLELLGDPEQLAQYLDRRTGAGSGR